MKRFFGLIAITLGFFMALLDTTIVNITLPKMTAYYGTDVKTISWVLNGYNLAFAVCLITASRLADQFGRKKMYLAGVIAFTLASLLSGMSSSVEMLITFRVIQGLAAAFVVPVTMPMSIEMVSEKRRGALMGFWGAFAGLAAASGPALGGVLSENFGWESIFFINVPIGVLTVTLCAILVKESYDPTVSRKIDWLGMMTLSVSMFCVTLALIQANDKGWSSPYIIALFGVCLLSLIAFLVIENRVKEPLVQLLMMKIVPFSAGNLTLLMVGLGLMSGVFLLTFYLTNVLAMTELQAGLLITALPLTSMVCSAISGVLSQKFGNRWFTIIGMVALGSSIYLFGSLTPTSAKFDVVWRLMVGGLGLGCSMAPLLDAVMKSVPQDKSGMASGISNMARTLGQVLGAAILITMLSSNLHEQTDSAKTRVVSLVQQDEQLNSQVKARLVDNVKHSSGSTVPALDEILAQMEQQKQQMMREEPGKVEGALRHQFDRQTQAVEVVYPQITQLYRSGAGDAKIKSVALLQANAQLSDPVKAGIIANLNQVTEAGQLPSVQEIEGRLKGQEQTLLADAAQKTETNIRDEFSRQEREISALYPQIKSEFTWSVSNAFSRTFKLGSLLMLLGLVFGLFSDPGKNARKQIA